MDNVLTIFVVLWFIVSIGKFFMSKGGTRSKGAPSGARARPAKTPTQKALPNAASPWETFQAQNAAEQLAKATAHPNRARSYTPPDSIAADDPPPMPVFKSTFPTGGSGFRFKTADEIIRQSFGTLSTLKSAKRDD